MEVRANGDVVVDEAPKRFSGEDSSYFNRSEYNNYMTSRPQIFGKNQEQTENLIFGAPIYNGIEE